MIGKRKKDIKVAVFVLIIFWIVIVLFIGGFAYQIQRSSMNQLLELVENFTKEANNKVNEKISKSIKVLNVTSKYFEPDQIDSVDTLIKKFDEVIEKNNFRTMGIALKDGTSYLSNGKVINIADREYFKKAWNGECYVSSLIESKVDETQVNVYSVPVFEQDKVIAVLWASVETENFYKNLNLDFFNYMAEIFFIDNNGDLIAGDSTKNYNIYSFIQRQHSQKDNIKSLNKMKQDIKEEKDGYRMISYGTEDYYYYYTKIDYNNWWLLMKIPYIVIKEKNKNINNVMLFGSELIILISSIAIFLIYTKGRKIIKQLEDVAYVDDMTLGKNDIYLKEYIRKNKKRLRKEQWAFISVEITNINHLTNIVGVKNLCFTLKEVYEIFSEALCKPELIVHSYMGEYKVLVTYNTMEELRERRERVMTALKNLNIKTKSGIYLIEDEIDFEQMWLYTKIAKAHITEEDGYQVYNEQMGEDDVKKAKLEEDIKVGIKQKEFKAWFQPKYGRDGKTLVGAEALVRWYKYGSIICPYIFIPICEANGFIQEIDEQVLEDVCIQLKRWKEEGKTIVPISVNLSRSYLDEIGLIERLEAMLDQYGIEKKYIEFEVTESALIENEKKLKEVLNTIHDRGFQILLDDFGVGYSSIKTIADIKFDVIKIDKSFVDGLGEKRWEDIVEYTIALAKRLNTKILVEGVETKEQYEFLLQCDCEMFQGYYFQKPMDAQQFEKLL